MIRNSLVLFFTLVLLMQTTTIFSAESYSCTSLGINKVTKKIAVLKTSLLPIILEQPELDAQKRIAHGDFRFIAIQEFETSIPEVKSENDFKIVCHFGTREISGITHSAQNIEHLKLIMKFKKYISRYNLFLIKYYKTEYLISINKTKENK
jgi:hypothetical protein